MADHRATLEAALAQIPSALKQLYFACTMSSPELASGDAMTLIGTVDDQHPFFLGTVRGFRPVVAVQSSRSME